MGEGGKRSRESRDALMRVVRNPAVRRIELAFAASVIGDWANVVAAAVYVYQQSGAFGVGALAVAAFLLMGLGNSVVDINASTILQRVVPEAVLGRVFGAMESILIATMALGALATPLLLHVGGVRLTFVVLGVGVGAVTLVALPALVRIDRVAMAPAATGLLRQVAFLAPLPDQVLERLAASAERVQVAAGAVVFREGDPGDRFYVVESGRVEILGRSFTAGQSFGEIALLRSVPRTATVTAAEDTVLVALDGPAFVAAVTSQGDARDAAESVVRARLGA